MNARNQLKYYDLHRNDTILTIVTLSDSRNS